MMKAVNLDLFYDRLGYYPLLLVGFAIAGLFGYLQLSKEKRKNEPLKFCLEILVTVGFYELVATFVSSQKIVNLWVYNLFNAHVAAVLFMLLIGSFLKRESHKKMVNIFIVLFLLISLVLHLTGFVHYNDSGEYISFLNTVLILCCCGLYFFELITIDEFLEIDPLKEFSFWASTAILFYFSSSFMVYISFKYLYTYHLDIYYMVIQIPRHMTLLCNLLLCFGIYSPLIKDRFQLEIIHV
ncbi:hypothetical protein [Algoriphagus sp. A40]|uniref:hypothetical protein n=1 Tax=Algoriphagus sp. A40 TaxID=1945863 RepID=UPI0009860366|nr:hypothetical protein [Algoriphagus sp. A40]OOG78877.1 hypothetical protein B0E43_00525 [Algoriphagus sp. A40]